MRRDQKTMPNAIYFEPLLAKHIEKALKGYIGNGKHKFSIKNVTRTW